MTKRKLNRRKFLKNATGITAASIAFRFPQGGVPPYIVLPSVLGKSGKAAPSNRIVMGCIGMGSKGIGNMRSFLSREEVRVIAVCDVDKNQRDKAKKIVDDKYQNDDCKAYLDFREVIERKDINALSLSLPDHWHSIPVIMGAQAGKDMYAEKPLARTIHEGREMVKAVQRYGVVWQTGSQQRSSANFHHACELVRNGRIGKIQGVEVGLPTGRPGSVLPVAPVPEGLDWDFWLGPAPWRPYQAFGRNENGPHWNWRWIMDYSGGQLTDWAGHHIDIAHWGLGMDYTGPIEIEGKGVYPREGINNVPIEYKFTCKYANSLIMTVANNKQIPQGTKWYGEKGWIYVNRGKLEADPPDVLKEVIGPNEIKLYESRDHHGNFLECIKSHKETVAPIEAGHRSISVGLLGEISMLTERKLKWDPQKERFLNCDEANRMLSRPMRSPWHL